MSAVRCRVELKHNDYNLSQDEREKNFRYLFAFFKRKVNEQGIFSRWKECQYFESKGQKSRRKRKEAKIQRLKEQEKLKDKLRENFINRNDF